MRQPFAHITNDHAFAPLVKDLRHAIADMERTGQSGAVQVQAELKVVRDPTGRYRPDRFYWSEQHRGTDAPFGFAARTLAWSAKEAGAGVIAFPSDPYLATAEGLLARWSRDGVDCRVLRYVPLRRLTLRVEHPVHGLSIAKVKRRSRFHEAYDLIGRVAFAAEAARLPVAVSRPLGIEPGDAVYFQSLLPGRDLSDGITGADTAAFERLGEIHGALHALAVDGLPVRTNRHWLDMAAADWSIVELYLPDLAGRLAPALDRLAVTMPPDEAPAFCHGDFVCSQVLVSGDAWSVTDFDLCHRGDPARDAAMFLATLPYDVPAFREAGAPGVDHPAGRAYLDGWSRTRGVRADTARLAWHGLCATLYVLGLMLKKDRWSPAVFAALEEIALRHARDLGAVP